MAHTTPKLHRPAIRNRHDESGIAPGPSKRSTAVAAFDGQRRAVWAAYVACAAGLAYAVPHFWWYLGLSWAYPGDFAEITNQSTTQVVGDWVIAILALCFSLLPLALVKPWGRILPRRLLLVSIWVASVGLVLWSLGYFYLRMMLATGRVVSAPDFAAEDTGSAAAWGFYWYGIFLVWGLSFGVTAWWSRQTRQRGTSRIGCKTVSGRLEGS